MGDEKQGVVIDEERVNDIRIKQETSQCKRGKCVRVSACHGTAVESEDNLWELVPTSTLLLEEPLTASASMPAPGWLALELLACHLLPPPS